MTQCQAQLGELTRQNETLEKQLAEERMRADQLEAELRRSLAAYEEKERVLLDRVAERSRITISDAVLFASGSARLTAEGRAVLDRIGKVVAQYPDREIRVEGHTDNVPIAARYQHRYRTNWELSSARAHAVLHYIAEKYNLRPDHLAAVGCGEHRAIASNTTPEGRATNRRVVIVVGSVLEDTSASAPRAAAR